MGGRAALLAAVGLLAVAGCGGSGDDGAKTTALADLAEVAQSADSADGAGDTVEAGDCLGPGTLGDTPTDLATQIDAFGLVAYTAMADDPLWANQVDCSQPHAFEVYDVVTLPADLDEQVVSYADLLADHGPLAKAVRTAVGHGCATALGPSAAVMDASPLQADVMPVLNSAGALQLASNPLPPASWAGGDHGFACLLEQDPPGTVMAADIATGALPYADRVCLDGTAFTGCDQPHDAERIAVLSVDTAVATGALRGRQAVDADGRVNLGDDEWALLDEVCDRYLREVTVTPAPGLVGVANTYPESYPDTNGRYWVLCSAQAPFGADPADVVTTSTSVFDG